MKILKDEKPQQIITVSTIRLAFFLFSLLDSLIVLFIRVGIHLATIASSTTGFGC